MKLRYQGGSLVSVEIKGGSVGSELLERLFTPDALALLESLHRTFERSRLDVLLQRARRQKEIRSGARLRFDHFSTARNDSTWRTASVPKDLKCRRVEITGPTDPKMVINALNSGADVFMADFEDSNTPTFANMMNGQITLQKAIRRELSYVNEVGKRYHLGPQLATLIVRPRGWHLVDRHVLVDGEPIAGAILDFALYLVHNADALKEIDSGPYFYLPKLESAEEAALWAKVFAFSESWLDLPHSTIKATVLLETFPAVFQIDEILHELKDWVVGMNAGRWDYLFSFIKTYGNLGSEFILPDRNSVTMNVPFMRAYAELLVKSCHQRGAYAIGGMAAFIPSRKDEEINKVAMEKVREDKTRELIQGFDGSWVAHPDLVPLCMEVFSLGLGSKDNQVEVVREDLQVTEDQLSVPYVEGGRMTLGGLRNDVSVAVRYLRSWLDGQGAVSIYNLMEDAATAEIARAQIWQWVNAKVQLDEGDLVTQELVELLIAEEVADLGGDDKSVFAANLLRSVSLSGTIPEFLTTVAYDILDD